MAAAVTHAVLAGASIAFVLAFVPARLDAPALTRPHAPAAAAEESSAAVVPAPKAGAFRQLIPVEVLRVIDGDTLEVRAEIWLDQWIVTRVRLRDIDAPERAARCKAEAARAEAARRHLTGLVAEGPVFLTDLGRDKYGGRVLGHLIAADGRDLGQAMLQQGHARPYAGRSRETWC